MISKSACALFIVSILIAGCERKVTPPVPTWMARPPGWPPELELLEGMPVSPKCRLTSLPDCQEQRHYLSFDLNDDGLPEYFVEDSAGAHSMTFVILDSTGKLLISLSDTDTCDRLVILSRRHNGYRDIVTSYDDPGGMDVCRLTFDGKRYVRSKYKRYRNDRLSEAAVELQHGACAACWYSDSHSVGAILFYGTRNSR